MQKQFTTKHLLWGIIILDLLIGLIAIKIFAKLPISDELEYNEVALALINHQDYPIVHDLLLPPGFPFLLAASYLIFGYHYYIIYLINFLLLGGIGCLIYLTAYRFLKIPKYFALLPALTVITWPYFMVFASQLLTELLFTFFLVLFLYLFLDCREILTKKNRLQQVLCLLWQL